MADVPKLHLLAYAVAGVLVVLAATRFLGGGDSGGQAAPLSVDGAPSGAAEVAPGHGRRGRGQLYVHVAGAVRRPGLYRVGAGARVAAAIERAGGLTRRADLAGVNLAMPVEDGQQVIVPRLGEAGALPTSGPAGAGAPTGTAAAGAAGARMSLATATPEQLDTLDGIGPTLASRIVEYRKSHGGFRSIAELRQVEGIGEKRFEALRQALRP